MTHFFDSLLVSNVESEFEKGLRLIAQRVLAKAKAGQLSPELSPYASEVVWACTEVLNLLTPAAVSTTATAASAASAATSTSAASPPAPQAAAPAATPATK